MDTNALLSLQVLDTSSVGLSAEAAPSNTCPTFCAAVKVTSNGRTATGTINLQDWVKWCVHGLLQTAEIPAPNYCNAASQRMREPCTLHVVLCLCDSHVPGVIAMCWHFFSEVVTEGIMCQRLSAEVVPKLASSLLHRHGICLTCSTLRSAAVRWFTGPLPL